MRQRPVVTWAEFQQSVVGDAIDQWRKRLESCIHAEGGHFEHLLWRCLPDIPVATHHNRLFSEPPTFGRTQHTFSQIKKFCISYTSAVTFFQVEWASGLQFVFFLDNVDNQNNVRIILLKNDFWILATCDRQGEQVYKLFMSNFLKTERTENH